MILGLMTGMHISATVFLFMYPTPANFLTWSGVTTAIIGVVHYFLTRQECHDADSKP